jgi:hypothetical protein
VHHVWQWGITQSDLIAFADKLGFDLVHTKNTGQFHNLVNFDYISFVFKKR